MNEGDMYELARTDIGFEAFLEAVGKQDPGDVVFAFVWADRWTDVKRLLDDPLYGERARMEWDFHEMMVCQRARDDQRVAKMLDDHPELRTLYETCKQVWCICDMFYPHISIYVEVEHQLLCITGDGLGLAYFDVETLKNGGKLTLVKNNDDKLGIVFERVGIEQDVATTLTKLEVAMAVFRRKTNEKVNPLR